MRFAPETPPISPLHIVRRVFLASLAFGVASVGFMAPVAAVAQQDLATTIPSLSGYDSETRQSMELACISKKSSGPVAYGACLNRQIASLQGSPGIPSLNGYDSETRQSMELACISKKSSGPVDYATCLNRQIASLQGSPGIPSLSGYDSETRQSMELACISKKSSGPVDYAACLNQQIASLHGLPAAASLSGHDSEARPTAPASSGTGGTDSEASKGRGSTVPAANPTSRFTTENIMKVHQGMGSSRILEMFGAPKNVSQSVCGAAIGKPWSCTTWEYSDGAVEWATFTFSGDNGSLVLNNFDIHRK